MDESFPAPNTTAPASDSAASTHPSPIEPHTPPATFAATMTPASPQQPEPLASRPAPLTKKPGGFVRPGQGVESKATEEKGEMEGEEKGKVGGGALRRLREGVRKVMMRSGGGKGKEVSEGKKKGGDWMGAGGD